MIEDPELIERILRVTAFDYCGDLFWNTDAKDAPVKMFITCSDIFWWGTADCEQVTQENILVLESAIDECEQRQDYLWGPALFVARVRRLRPQGAVLKEIPSGIRELFEACGPVRPVNFDNPLSEGRTA